MKVVMISIGTRGDIEPFMAIAELLKNRGHKTICAFPEQFRESVIKDGHEFYGLGSKFLELIESEAGKVFMGSGGSFFKKARLIGYMSRKSKEIASEYIQLQHDLLHKEKPDLVLYHSKSLYPILWGFANKGKAIMINLVPCIVHVVKEHPVIALTQNLGPLLNTWTYKLTNHFTLKTILKYTQTHQNQIVGRKVSLSELRDWYLNNEKTLYPISPTLFSKPEYWPEHINIVGYHERTKTSHWAPSEELVSFLDKHEKILFLSFGSMTSNSPKKKTEMILKVLHRHKIPALINTSWGGLEEVPDTSGHVYFVKSIPYEWIMPKMYAAIHHGGSGTTHSSLKYGCATMIIPHIIDQFYWNKLIASRGAGPLGIPAKKLNSQNLEPLIIDLWHNDKYKGVAMKISKSMKEEYSEDRYVNYILN